MLPRKALKPVITREDIRNGYLLDMLRRANAPFRVYSEEELDASVDSTIADGPDTVRNGGDAWVFGYGSLMWNPAIHYEHDCIGLLSGYHRRFCLWTPLGRGTPENPGLVLGLTRGGSCKGVAYRICGTKVREEFRVLWRREMCSDGYMPRWVKVTCSTGPITALTFVINRTCQRYAGRLPDQEAATAIAAAHGALGSNADYLNSTVQHLEELGIPDRRLHALQKCLLRCSEVQKAS